VLQKFGLLTFVWIIFQVFVGAGSVWFDGKLFGGGMKAKAIWKYHRLVSKYSSTPTALIEDKDCPATFFSLYSS